MKYASHSTANVSNIFDPFLSIRLNRACIEPSGTATDPYIHVFSVVKRKTKHVCKETKVVSHLNTSALYTMYPKRNTKLTTPMKTNIPIQRRNCTTFKNQLINTPCTICSFLFSPHLEWTSIVQHRCEF